MWLSCFHQFIRYQWNIINMFNKYYSKVWVLDVNLIRSTETLHSHLSRNKSSFFLGLHDDMSVENQCSTPIYYWTFFPPLLSFVPGTSTGSFCSLFASEISNRKQNAALRSKAWGGHLRAGNNVYDCCPADSRGRLFLTYMCARANCGWWSGTNSKRNEPHSEL